MLLWVPGPPNPAPTRNISSLKIAENPKSAPIPPYFSSTLDRENQILQVYSKTNEV